MRQYGFIYNNFNEMKIFINTMDISGENSILVQIFTGVIKFEFIKNIINEIKSILPQAEVIGSTTAGEIYKDKVMTGTTIISFTIFEKTQIKSKLLESNNNEYEVGVNIVKELAEKDTKVIILFSDGLLTDSVSIVKGIQSTNSNFIICGGKAGDNGYLKETFVFTKEGITKNGVAAVSLTGKQLNVTTEINFGWSTIGKLMTVTHASGNRIYTIDGIKTADIYRKYFGHEVAKSLPMSATEFPLILTRNGVHIARVAFGSYEDGSLSFLGDVETNDKVQFGYGNVNVLKEQSLEIANKLMSKNVEAIFIYSCSVRRAFMQDKIELEINPLNNIAQAFGFFTYGEFFTSNHSNELLNVTMTVLGISEGKHTNDKNEIILPKDESPSKSFFEGKDLGVIKVFTHLVNQSTKELQETNQMLEEQKYKIEQMNNITKSIMEINTEMLSSGGLQSVLQMILDKASDIIPNAMIGSILLIENGRLCYKAIKGYSLNEIKDVSYKLEDVHQYTAYNTDELYNPMIIKDVGRYLFNKEDKYNDWKVMITQNIKELLTCGIGIDGQIKGFINMFSTSSKRKFNEEDKALLKYLCCDIGIVLKNAQLLEHIVHMSKFDSLTEVYNRNYFGELLSKIVNKGKLSNEVLIIGLLDLNNLKTFNDTYGHDAGDRILIEFTRVFKMQIDKDDIFARTGGDEFTVVFVNKDRNQAINIISKICGIFKNNPIKLNTCEEEISFAYGLSEFPSDSQNINELLKIADKRMYEKKKIMKQNK